MLMHATGTQTKESYKGSLTMADASNAGGDDTVALRLCGAGLLLAASLAGVLPPILRGVDAAPAHRLKALAAGTMLGLAVLHVIADVIHRLYLHAFF